MNETWQQIQNILAQSLNSGIYQVWVKPLQGEYKENSLIVSAPNNFVASKVKERLEKTILDAAAQVLGFQPYLNVKEKKGVDPIDSPRKILQQKTGNQKELTLPSQESSHNLNSYNWRFKFDDFIVGSCNQLAYTACQSLCQKDFPAGALFISSSPGLGKTHLLQAIGNHICRINNQTHFCISYLSSEQFANQMINAIKNGQINDFKKRFRNNIDMLLLEDIHFFQGKAKMQEELLSLIKELQTNGKKVVFSSSFLPKDLNKVDSQLTSYFCSGLLAPIQPPDYDLRCRVVEKKAEQFSINIPEKITSKIASNIENDFRQLESCIQNLALKSKVLNQEISSDLVREVLKNYTQNSSHIDMEKLISFVSESFEIPKNKLSSKSRKKDIVVARNTAFFLGRKYTNLSLNEIGKYLNRRHSTVLKGITSIEKEIKKDSHIGRQLGRIEKRLSD